MESFRFLSPPTAYYPLPPIASMRVCVCHKEHAATLPDTLCNLYFPGNCSRKLKVFDKK